LFRAIAWLEEFVMKFAELKDLTLVELSAKGRDLRQEMFTLRLQQASAQLEKPARLRTLRKDIARVETRISELGNKAKVAATK
jgi:large subunit ribosomal protein L29